MTALSLNENKTNRRTADDVQLIQIHDGHRLNNQGRAPYLNGPAAARSLLLHAAEQLRHPTNGQVYFNALRQAYDNATLSGANMQVILTARAARANDALERSQIVIDDPRQLNLISEVAQINQELAAKLMPELQASGRPPEKVIDVIDDITRRALRSITAVQAGAEIGTVETNHLETAAANLAARLDRIPGTDPETNRARVQDLVNDVREVREAGPAAEGQLDDRLDFARTMLAGLLEDEIQVVTDREIPEGTTAAEIDARAIMARFERLAITDAEGAQNDAQLDPNAWQNDLIARLAAVPGIDHSDDAELVARFGRTLNEIESTIPTRLERGPENQIFEVDEIGMSDPVAFAKARDALPAELRETLGSDELDEMAAAEVYEAMTDEQRIEAVNTIGLNDIQRVELGMQMIGSTPPIIKLPEAELSEARFDLAMKTKEEAVVMSALIQWAGRNPKYPGPEAGDELEAMLRTQSTSAVLGENTFGIAVINNPSLIELAGNLVEAHTRKFPEDRMLVYAELPENGQELMDRRAAVLAEMGREHTYLGNEGATREFGAWTLPGNEDRLLGKGRFDGDMFVAASDRLSTFARNARVNATSKERADARYKTAKKAYDEAIAVRQEARELVEASYDKDLIAKVEQLTKEERARVRADDGAPRNPELNKAIKAMRESAPAHLRKALERSEATVKATGLNEAGARRLVNQVARQNVGTIYANTPHSDIRIAEILQNAHRVGKLEHAYAANPNNLDRDAQRQNMRDNNRQNRNAMITTSHGTVSDLSLHLAYIEASKLLNGRNYDERQFDSAVNRGIDAQFTDEANLNIVSFTGSNFLTRVTKEVMKDGKPGRASVYQAKKDANGKVMFHKSGKHKGKPINEPVIDERGLKAIDDRLVTLPKTSIVMFPANTAKNGMNPVVGLITERAEATKREIVQAQAWRIFDMQRVETGGRKVTLVESSTVLDLGVVTDRRRGQDGKMIEINRPRELGTADLKNTMVQVNGAGQMNKRVYDAIVDYRVKNGDKTPLTPEHALEIQNHLISRGMRFDDSEMVKISTDNMRESIMVESMPMFADSCVVASDLGNDYVSARAIANADRLGKLEAVIGQDGKSVTLEKAREASYQFAPTLSENTFNKLHKEGVFETPTRSDSGQLLLTSFPGLSPQNALDIAAKHETMGDLLEAARTNEVGVRLPKEVVHQLTLSKAWENADQRFNEVFDNMDESKMNGFTAIDPAYPQKLIQRAQEIEAERTARLTGQSADQTPLGHASIAPLFTKGDVDLNLPMITLIAGGDRAPAEADLEAVAKIAAEARESNMAVSVHLSGKTSAGVLESLAAMNDDERPRVVIIGKGHPDVYEGAEKAALEKITSLENGGFVTNTPLIRAEPTESEIEKSRENNEIKAYGKYAINEASSNHLLVSLSEAVVVVNSSARGSEVRLVGQAIEAGKPIAAVGPVPGADPKIADMRHHDSDHSLNRQLLGGPGSVTQRLQQVTTTITSSFVPDSAPAEFGRFGDPIRKKENRERNDEIGTTRITASQVTARWTQPVYNVQDGQAAGQFIESFSKGEVPSIALTATEIAIQDRDNDRFLDTYSREVGKVGVEVRKTFSELTEENALSVEDMQRHMSAQNRGR